ncbi:MAG: hypothetical protein Q8P83_01040 [bacterium]|nr:hypothetical protein [bacterium]
MGNKINPVRNNQPQADADTQAHRISNGIKIIALILGLALILPYSSLAQDTTADSDDTSVEVEDEADDNSDDSTTSATPLQKARDVLKNRANQLKDKRTEAHDEAEDAKANQAERRGTQRDARLARLKNSMAVHINRMQNAINKLQNITERIDGAVSNLNEQGVDTSSVDSLITQSNTQKSEAVRLLDDAKAKHAAIIDSDHPKEAVKEFITSLRALKSQLVELHKTLKEIVKTLKSLNNSSTDVEGEDN